MSARDNPLCPYSDRRTFVSGAASLSFASLVGVFPSSAIAKRPPSHRCIDVHNHFLPPQYLKEGPPSVQMGAAPGWSPKKAVEDMDKAGVDLSMLSFSSPYQWFSGIEPGRRLARLCNDYSAQMVRDFPGRFGLFAGLPLLSDSEGCLREIAYVLDTLKAEGVTVMTSYDGKWLGDPTFAPIWEELDRRRAIVFVHPAIPGCCANTVPGVSPAYAELPFDTARTVISLWHNGVLDRWPSIRFIFSHSGGALPMVADRVDKFGRPGKDGQGRLQDANEAFRKLYFDTANAASRPALSALRAMAAPGHILYGSDYPYIPMERGLHDIALAQLTEIEARSIMFENALALMPGLNT